MAGWTHEQALLEAEIRQRTDEGCGVPAWIREATQALKDDGQCWDEVRAAPLWAALAELPEDRELAAAEPNDLAGIRALRPDGPRDLHWTPTTGELIDRLHGAWTGRAVGCALGKPVESPAWAMAMSGGRCVGRERVRALLQQRNEWPLRDYFSSVVPEGMPPLRCPASMRERIAYMEPDDDIHYTLVGLGILESIGPEFTWADVARYWTHHLPYAAICTAETQAILNFWNRTGHVARSAKVADTWATPEWTRRHRNPYREWIGAQIRSDGWAWACAGKPELAAEFAWRDASWTHTRNGQYGEMLFAAIQAAAFAEPDMRRCIDIGLAEIPRDCRLARWVHKALGWRDECATYEDALDRMGSEDTLVRMSPVHTINNAVVCVLALLYAGDEIDAATCTAVMAGLDTDCNGATVGSVVGAMTGRAAYQGSLAGRLDDTIRPQVFGFEQVSMGELARRHAQAWQRVETWHRQRA